MYCSAPPFLNLIKRKSSEVGKADTLNIGGFIGHAVPGFFFCFIGLWYTVIRAVLQRIPFTSSISYSGADFETRKFPVNSAIKLACSTIGFFIETGSGLSQLKDGFPMRDMQHMTMYFFFGISGVIDILTYKKYFLPQDTDFVSLTMALTIELILFIFHIHDRYPLDIQVHQLLILAIGANAVAVICMSFHLQKLIAALSFSWAMIVHGTRFIQLGFILYNPLPNAQKWSKSDEEELSLVVFYFVLHCLIVFLFMVATYLAFGYIYTSRGRTVKQRNKFYEAHTDEQSD